MADKGRDELALVLLHRSKRAVLARISHTVRMSMVPSMSHAGRQWAPAANHSDLQVSAASVRRRSKGYLEREGERVWLSFRTKALFL